MHGIGLELCHALEVEVHHVTPCIHHFVTSSEKFGTTIINKVQMTHKIIVVIAKVFAITNLSVFIIIHSFLLSFITFLPKPTD